MYTTITPTGRLTGKWQTPPSVYSDSAKYWVSTTGDQRRAIEEAFVANTMSRTSLFRPWKGSFVPQWNGSYVQGLIPPSVTKRFNIDELKTITPHFAKAKDSGRIVVNPYRAASSVTITASVPYDKELVSSNEPLLEVYACGVFTPVADPMGQLPFGWCYTFGGRIYRLGTLHVSYETVKKYPKTKGSTYDINAHGGKVIDRLRSLERNAEIIQSCLANANTGQFDVLSELAEAPETLLGALSGCKTILKMTKEAKAKDVRLRNKVKKIQAIENPTLQQRKDVASILDAIADVWLTWRLAIYPISKSIDELMTGSFGQYYYRYREFQSQSEQLDVSFGSERCFVPVENRCFIKRRYLSSIASLGWNSATAVWNIIPGSFVVDRFISIGDFITAHLSPNLSVDQGATYSWKVKAGNGATFGESVDYSVDISYYKRDVINPYHYCGLFTSSNLTLNQHYDHVALGWKLALNDFFTSKKG